MKKILLLACFMMSIACFGQTKKAVENPVKTNQPFVPTIQQSSKYEEAVDSILKRVDSLLQINNYWIEHIELDMSLKNRYKLYKTENLYNMLRLDTKTGRIEQVQWSLDDNKEGTFTINNEDLNLGYGFGSCTFELYPTNNMYQFILLDKTNGRMWHVQWGIGDAKRWIRRIY